MNRRNLIALVLAGTAITFSASTVVAQKAADEEGVKAASKAFYQALGTLDGGPSMEKVWAHTPYVTYVGPRSKTIIVGWEPLKKYWADTDKLFSQRPISLSDQHIHANGNLAWEVGRETGPAKMKDGTDTAADYIVTNVYEKIGGRWLIVSHHVQPKPQ
jgi:ketosteroid isomerase-like protein